MPNTSVHFPDGILEQLDELAHQQGISRNRLIVEGCLKVLRRSKSWPDGFLDPNRHSESELEILRSGREEFEQGILDARRSRSSPPC